MWLGVYGHFDLAQRMSTGGEVPLNAAGRALMASAGDPESAAVERDEELTLLEFAATLTSKERQVFACKYGSSVVSPSPTNGEFILKIAEPMDEVTYLDRLQLLVIDHPAGASVYPDDAGSAEALLKRLVQRLKPFHEVGDVVDARCVISPKDI